MTIFIARGIKWYYKFSLVARNVEIHFLPTTGFDMFVVKLKIIYRLREYQLLYALALIRILLNFLLFSYPNSL